MIFSSTVHPPFKPGTALVDYLTARFTYHDRESWLRHIALGKITCNGQVAEMTATVAPNDIVSYDPGEFKEPQANLNYRIIYEDEWLLGIDKPSNLLVHRAGKSIRNNLMYQLRSIHVPLWPEAHCIHRLDRDTSGVLLVAKNSVIKAAMTGEQVFKKLTKIYYAVVRGRPPVRDIDLPLGKADCSAIPYKFCVKSSGKPAVTRIIASQQLGACHSLLTLQPVTGRTHQIRIHLHAIGAPVVGDKLYGQSEKDYLNWRDDPLHAEHQLEFPRHALHCASMTFIHPYTKKVCRVEAEIPEDMKVLIASLSQS
jgi:23S rRNA pseudouridine1911/1915/1917 synthase